jgi:CelD/BcsL family acetyltransferase involved in cellulose biosynthesis
MTKEELKQEAEKSLDKRLGTYAYIRKQDCYTNYVDGYIDSAEPREKRIAELEDKLANADYQLEGRDNEIRELKEELKTAYRKGMRHMAKALKDYDRTDGTYTDYFEHTVDKVLQREQLDFEEYGTLADQLTKAKELLKDITSSYGSTEVSEAQLYLKIKKAELFLKSEVENV